MKPVELLEILHTAERLKDVTRHSYTSGGRHESVAEHSWRITLMAFLLRDEFPELDMDKVLRMCLIHDLGECFTGDIPAFDKTADDSAREEELLGAWVAQLPQPVRGEMAELYAEMEAFGTPETSTMLVIKDPFTPSASVSIPQPKDLISCCGNFLKIFRKIWSRAAKKPRSAESAMPPQSTGRAGRSPALPVHSPCQFIRHARFSPPSRAGSPCAGGSGTAKTPHFRSRRCG